MRPIEPAEVMDAFSQPEPRDADAPLSAAVPAATFWDHLGATRAEEYAAGDILPGVPAPPVPPPMPPQTLRAPEPPRPDGALPAVVPGSGSPGLGDGVASLDETLRAHDVAAQSAIASLSEIEAPGIDHALSLAALSAAQGRSIPAERVVAAPLPRAGRWRRQSTAPKRTSRIAYRLQRMWLTPVYRHALRIGAPVLALVLGLGWVLHDAERRAAIVGQGEALYAAVVDRPEFMVETLRLPDLSLELDAAIRDRLEPELPRSSFRLDLEALRREVETLDAIRSADLRLASDGVLAVSITERVPAVVWRSYGGLELLDPDGFRVARLARRGLRSDLPLIAGEGANDHVPEALELLDAAAPLGDRLRGLVRVGERRWDVVLDRDQRIRLPEKGALGALERVIALQGAQDLLNRDLIAADMRNPARPVLQISDGAMDTLRSIRLETQEARPR